MNPSTRNAADLNSESRRFVVIVGCACLFLVLAGVVHRLTRPPEAPPAMPVRVAAAPVPEVNVNFTFHNETTIDLRPDPEVLPAVSSRASVEEPVTVPEEVAVLVEESPAPAPVQPLANELSIGGRGIVISESAVGGQSGTCLVRGRVFLNGTPPAPRNYVLSPEFTLEAGRRGLPTKGKLEFYRVGPEGGMGDVVVYAQWSDGSTPPAMVPSEVALVEQAFSQFVPYVSSVQVGQPVQFANQSPFLNQFQVGKPDLPNGKRSFVVNKESSIELSFEQPELFVRISSPINPWQFAYVNVISHPWFAQTDETGYFEIAGVPESATSIVVAHRKAGQASVEVNLRGRDEVALEFLLEVPTP